MYKAAVSHFLEFLTMENSPACFSSILELPSYFRKIPLIPFLLTKPFVILTGGSGTGKTKLAEAVARYYSEAAGTNVEVVAVGADWTDNLFVIGTVNVDETTYMFSPKVLDRANVLEFKVDDTDIAAFLESPRGYPAFERAEPSQAEAFLQLARRARRDPDVEGGLDGLSGAAAEAVRKHLVELFRILQRGRFEYAYRTANEVMRYLRVSRHLATDKAAWDGGGWRTDVDAQILQKLLPKLHGSVGRIGPLLAELAEYCQSGTVTGEDRNRREHAALRLQEAESLSEEDAVFTASLRKLKSMIRALNEEQFVSFIQ